MSLPCFSNDPGQTATRLTVVPANDADRGLEGLDPIARSWAEVNAFRGEAGRILPIPDTDGRLSCCLVGGDDDDACKSYGGLPGSLPPGTYRLDPGTPAATRERVVLGWGLGAYRYDRYRTHNGQAPAKLIVDDYDALGQTVEAVDATRLVRDLINTPAEDMGPATLNDVVVDLGQAFGASVTSIFGDDLLAAGYPAIHTVGRASSRPPGLIDLRWGDQGHPKVTLVGKGICFDTGGLDIKPTNAMLNMKKDMGGAAHVVGLARMIMATGLPIRLRVLIPVADNMIAGNSFKPMDIVKTRKGLTIEIGNTDAEGRVVLADALAEADTESPELIIDFATLTGAARVALGADLPALFCNRDDVAAAVVSKAMAVQDPMWRLPLWAPYRKLISSPVADINNAGEGGMGGAITAALFLQDFLSPSTPWMHIDTFAWNAFERPGRPKGGEALGMRAVFSLLCDRYASNRK